MALRPKVVELYKTVKEYPNKPEELRRKIHDAFMKNSKETDPKRIKALLAYGRYFGKEIEALYSLRKYRAMKNRYYDN